MPISPAARLSLCQYLDAFKLRIRSKGEKLWRDVEFDSEEGDTTVATVFEPTGDEYAVRLAVTINGWIGSCTCHEMMNCKHCYAVAKALLAKTPLSEKTPAAITGLAQAAKNVLEPEANVIMRPARPAKPPKPKLTPEQEFAAELEGKLGKRLARSDFDYAIAFHRFWERHRESRHITEALFANLLQERMEWNYASHQLWDEPPKSAWDAWLYFAAFLGRQKRKMPAFLEELTKPEDIEAMTGAWRRRREIADWKYSIQNYIREAPSNRKKVELRVIFEAEHILLESREALSTKPFTILKIGALRDLDRDMLNRFSSLDPVSRSIVSAFRIQGGLNVKLAYDDAEETVGQLLRNSTLAERVFTKNRMAFARNPEPLVWQVREPNEALGDYEFRLLLPDGSMPPPALIILDGDPGYYVTSDTIFETPPMGALKSCAPVQVPSDVIETAEGAELISLVRAPMPPRLAEKVEHVHTQVRLTCELLEQANCKEVIRIRVTADHGPGRLAESLTGAGWHGGGVDPQGKNSDKKIILFNRDAMALAQGVIDDLGLTWDSFEKGWYRQVGKKFPGEFADWAANLPPHFDLRVDPVLATLRDNPVSAQVRLDVTESAAMDWFDLQVTLDVSDTTLTKEELDLLLAANGGYVRLSKKGWRRLALQFSADDEKALAEAGIDSRDFSGEKHRLHALQLAGKSTERLLPAKQAEAVRRRVEEIQTRVAPDVPRALRAELRPYQLEGFHFLAYLSANRFGGILADDMGLGKTLQTLAWMEWLRGQKDSEKKPFLVVCPKSVVLNWQGEAKRFLPKLRVVVLEKGATDAAALKKARAKADVIVINYAQLRMLETELLSVSWLAAVLDEAQFIKNPDSQTTRVAVQLNAQYRLALTGTPIENRLLDLWSLMHFAMPGALGARAVFQRRFDQKKDPYARLRLASRVRPFVLRRAKGEVAKDLPERSEEDLLCEMEGAQAKLYAAELKRARQMLLKIQTNKELDSSRFNILTSLLRLRQICCHPALVSKESADEESAKLTALLDLLEPLMEEGHKVLIFSQFTGMLDLIQTAIHERAWSSFLLTGKTEDRQSLVDAFQTAEGSAVFLISLRAGGFGLNLTAASYVVLFDPWWNPAVENQAIDRTHRIGQTNKVNAYRLVVKNSIEEKIRLLQTQKRALADDILGEEAFAKTLSLDDFKFLLGDE